MTENSGGLRFVKKTWRETDSTRSSEDDYDLAVGPRGPLSARKPLRSEREANLDPIESFDDQVAVLQKAKIPRVCGCSDEERKSCHHSC